MVLQLNSTYVKNDNLGLAVLWFVVSGLVPTLEVAVALGHLRLVFTVWPYQQDPCAHSRGTDKAKLNPRTDEHVLLTNNGKNMYHILQLLLHCS